MVRARFCGSATQIYLRAKNYRPLRRLLFKSDRGAKTIFIRNYCNHLSALASFTARNQLKITPHPSFMNLQGFNHGIKLLMQICITDFERLKDRR